MVTGKSGIPLLGGQGQQDVIEQALDRAGVDPANIGYLEAHGTGTVLGDPIELRSVSTAWQQYTQESGYCAIGSVKGNIGHLDTLPGLPVSSKRLWLSIITVSRQVLIAAL